MAFEKRDLPALLRLLQDGSTTRREAQEVLRRANRHFTAPNWETFFEKRLKPAIAEKAISVDDVAALLRDSEEHGRQHVFLYRMPPATVAVLLNQPTLEKALQKEGLLQTLTNPRILEEPDQPTFVETRLEFSPTKTPIALVVKRVSIKEALHFREERRTNMRLIYEYDIEKARAVDLVKVRHDGLCEVRIQAHKGAKYAKEASALLLALGPILAPQHLQRVPLSKAKDVMVEKRADFAGRVKFSRSVLRNSQGTTLAASVGMETDNLFEDKAADKSWQAFLGPKTHCDANNAFLNAGKDEDGKDIWVHVLIEGEPNEFILTAQCTMREYEHALAELRFFGR